MPIKRARSKPSTSSSKQGRDLFDAFKKTVRDYKFPKIEKKKERKLTKVQEAEFQDVRYQLQTKVNSIHKKRLPNRTNPKFWDVLVNKMPKNLIGRAIKFRDIWDKDLKRAMDKRHEDKLYRKD